MRTPSLLLVRLLVQIEHRVRALVAVILTLVKIVNLNFLLSVRIGVAVNQQQANTRCHVEVHAIFQV